MDQCASVCISCASHQNLTQTRTMMEPTEPVFLCTSNPCRILMELLLMRVYISKIIYVQIYSLFAEVANKI